MNGSVWTVAAAILGIVVIILVVRPDNNTVALAMTLISGLAGWHAVKSNGTAPTTTT